MSGLPPLPLAAEAALPHRLPLRLVDTLVEVTEDGALCEALPRPGHLFANAEGVLHAVALLEMMAQSFAALRGYRMFAGGGPVQMGYLVGVRNFRSLSPARTADTLRIEVRETGSVDVFHMADAKVLRGEELLAEGSIRVWTPPEAP